MKNIKQIALLTMGLALLSCAKEKAYEEAAKDFESDELINKEVLIGKNAQLKGYGPGKDGGLCDPKEPLLFVPSVGEVPRAVSAARPYELGKAKVVTCELKEDKLVFTEVEDDSRFAVNNNNKSPVFEIELKHREFKCKEDQFGDCTGVEEEDKKKHWSKRKNVVIDKNKIEIIAKDANLSLDLYGLLDGCFSEVSKEVTALTVNNKSMNFTIKRQMDASLECASFVRTADDIRYTKFFTDYNFSLIKLSDLTDPNYQALNYPEYDQERFGFFKTTKVNMTTDNLTHVIGSKSYLLNRWSPNKDKITYYLSKHFYDKDMKNVLQATIDGIETVNLSLRKAGAKLQIELKDGRGVNEGDIRNNFLVLVKDPHASGVIGYGPSIKNPHTGEIVSARTIMYYGTIRKTIARAYDKMLETAPVIPTKDVTPAPATPTGTIAQDEASLGHSINHQAVALFDSFNRTVNELDPMTYLQREHVKEASFEESLKTLERDLDSLKDELRTLSEKTFYHNSMLRVTPLITQLGIKVRRPWNELTEKERAKVIEYMLPYLWVPTLVHEFGHNLGLRHNFLGSVDKDNFYTKNEAAAMNLKRIPEYSSIMDYAYNSHTELSIMGKYDVAALKYAYAREVTNEDGTVTKIKTTLEDENKLFVERNSDLITEKVKEFAAKYGLPVESYTEVKKFLELIANNAQGDDQIAQAEKMQEEFNAFTTLQIKPFKYCTDENVNNDALCNRHDEGVGYVGLAKHYVQRYAEYYKFRNLRGRKYDFNSIRGDFSYTLYVLNTFFEMRQIVSQFALFERYGLGETEDPVRKAEYEDLKEASGIIFKFFIDVVRQAPKSCVIYLKDDNDLSKSRLINIVPLAARFKSVTMCQAYEDYFKGPRSPFPANVKGNVKLVEAGKFINNATNYDRKEEVSDLISQVDVRGIGIDKVFAMSMLTERSSSVTGGFASFLDLPEYEKEIKGLIAEIVNNKLNANIQFKDLVGNTMSGSFTYNIVDTHSLGMSYNWIINGFLGLRYEQNDIRKAMLRFVKNNILSSKDEVDLEKNRIMYDELKVYRPPRMSDITDSNYDAVVEFKNKAGVVRHRFAAYKHNKFGMYLISIKPMIDELESLSEEQVEILSGFANDRVAIEDIKDEQVLKLIKQNESVVKDFAEGYINETVLIKTLIALAQ